MVQETFGDTDLVFPMSPEVGDVYNGSNLFPYEFMDDGRWRNIVNFNIISPSLPPRLAINPWIPELDGNGDEVVIPVPVSYSVETSSFYPLVNEPGVKLFDEFLDGDQTSQIKFFDSEYNTIFVSHVQGGNAAYRANDDHSGLIQGNLLEDYHVPNITGEMIYVWGSGPGAITNNHHLFVTVDLEDYVADMDTIDQVQWRVTYQHAIANGFAADNNEWGCSVWDEARLPQKHYYGTILTSIQSTGGGSYWGGTSVVSDFVNRGMDDFLIFPAGSKYLFISIDTQANNLVRDIKVEFIDPRDPGVISTRKLSGLAIPATGDKLYTASTLLAGTINEFTMSDPYDMDTAVFTQYENTFTNGTRPNLETVEPKGLWMRSDGNVVYLCDEKGKVKQFRMHTPFDITTLDDVQESNQWYWDDYYKEFTPVADPIDVHLSPDGDKLFLLESDNVIREYDITAWDISTAVYSGFSIDCTVKTAEAKSFTIDRTGKTLVIIYDGAMSQAILPTAHSLESSDWDLGDSLISIEDPKGIVFNNDNDKLYIADIPNDVDAYMRISSFEQSG